MILEKEKGGLALIALIILSTVLFIHGFIAIEAGFTELALKLHLFSSPASALLVLLSISILKSLGKIVVLNNEGLLVEEFSSKIIPWGVIKGASIKKQYLYRGGVCQWLVLHTTNDDRYLSAKLIKLNRLVGIYGVPVCNLSNYRGLEHKNLLMIQKNIEDARKTA